MGASATIRGPLRLLAHSTETPERPKSFGRRALDAHITKCTKACLGELGVQWTWGLEFRV